VEVVEHMEVKIQLVLVRKVDQVDQEVVLLLVQQHHLLQGEQVILLLLVQLKVIMVVREVFYNMVQVLQVEVVLALLDLQVIKVLLRLQMAIEEVMEVLEHQTQF